MAAHTLDAPLSTQRSARAIMPVKSKMDKLVSQSTAGNHSRGNDTAQKAPASFAVIAPNNRWLMCMITPTVRTANTVCSAIITAAEVKL